MKERKGKGLGSLFTNLDFLVEKSKLEIIYSTLSSLDHDPKSKHKLHKKIDAMMEETLQKLEALKQQ